MHHRVHVHPRNPLNPVSQQLQHLESQSLAKVSSLKHPGRISTKYLLVEPDKSISFAANVKTGVYTHMRSVWYGIF